jgi:predicted dehydrogenase
MAVAHIVESVKNNRPVKATGEQGLTLITIINALYESAQTGKEVRLD